MLEYHIAHLADRVTQSHESEVKVRAYLITCYVIVIPGSARMSHSQIII